MFGLIGMTGDDIYRNFHQGAGAEGLVSTASVLADFAGNYGERAGQIRALVARMESAWQGDAAGAAQRGAGPLAVEHDMSGMALGTAQDLTNRQAGSFGEAKSRVVPVPPKPELTNPAVILTDPTVLIDHERQVDEHSAAAQNNVDVMNGYSGASEYNTTNLPTSYGKLSADNAGIGVGTGENVGGAGTAVINTPDSANPDDASRRSIGTGQDVGDSPDDSSGDRTPVDDPGSAPPPGPGGGPAGGGSFGSGSPGVGSGNGAGLTTPETFVPGASPSPVGSVDPTAGRGPSPSLGPPSPGVGAVVAGTGGFGGSPRGGFGGGSPGGGAGPYGGGAGPRGGLPGGPGAGVGAEPHGAGARPGAGPAAATGRGGAPASGMPMGAPGRGRDAEDTEHQRPEWLEGGDPDELFGTDEMTAPPTIGAEDD